MDRSLGISREIRSAQGELWSWAPDYIKFPNNKGPVQVDLIGEMRDIGYKDRHLKLRNRHIHTVDHLLSFLGGVTILDLTGNVIQGVGQFASLTSLETLSHVNL